jgi:hypothetical protein
MLSSKAGGGEKRGPCPSLGCSSNAAACPGAVVWPSQVTVVSPVIIIMGRHQEGVPAARRPLPEWGGG